VLNGGNTGCSGVNSRPKNITAPKRKDVDVEVYGC